MNHTARDTKAGRQLTAINGLKLAEPAGIEHVITSPDPSMPEFITTTITFWAGDSMVEIRLDANLHVDTEA